MVFPFVETLPSPTLLLGRMHYTTGDVETPALLICTYTATLL